jgi:pimeloyl-ACP methyl ester carboxylesterase
MLHLNKSEAQLLARVFFSRHKRESHFNRNTKRSLFLLVVPLFFIAACSTSRDSVKPEANPQLEQIWTLRFNDDGSLANREDLDKYCEAIAAKPQTVVVFMHGWHGNVSPRNPNIQMFQADLTKVRDRTYKESGRTLTGICLTWRARTWPGLAEYPMYYRTRDRADKIATGSGIAESLQKLSNAMRPHGRERLIVAGHSMGARILGRVIAYHPELLNRLNLVLLANTADDSNSFKRTVEQVNAHPYDLGRLPKLVWVTSGKDTTTSIIYPTFQRGMPPGHDKRFIDYEVIIKQPSPGHAAYSAHIKRISKLSKYYAHNIRVVDGLGGHGDIWSEAMIQIVDYYVLR